MLYLKTDEEVEFLRDSNMLVSKTLAEVARQIRPGVTTLYLDRIAEEFIRDHSAVPAFRVMVVSPQHSAHRSMKRWSMASRQLINCAKEI